LPQDVHGGQYEQVNKANSIQFYGFQIFYSRYFNTSFVSMGFAIWLFAYKTDDKIMRFNNV